MNLAELEALVREMADDETGERLWTSERIRQLADEAQAEANFRTRFLVDSTSPRVCTVQLVAGQPDYRLHPAIIVPRRLEFVPAETGGRPFTLDRVSFDHLDQRDPHWTSQTGRPTAVVLDMQRGRFRLDRIPTATTLGTIRMVVWRRPLDAERLEGPDDEPCIPEDQHPMLAHWILHKLYMRKDAETFDRDLSDRHGFLFQQHFGPRPTMAQLRALATDHDGEITSHWF